MLKPLAQKVLDGGEITRDEALHIASLEGPVVFDLFTEANRIRESLRGKAADFCSITSAKTGGCPEDCSYCAQSARSGADIKTSLLIDKETLAQRAQAARRYGVGRFCIVTSGKKPNKEEFRRILEMVSVLKGLGLKPCATLGLIERAELQALRDAGLNRYHHNIETSERFFPRICSTHTYHDKLHTINEAKAAGLSLCSGGIFGLGEEWEDRVEMALALRNLDVDSVPVNFLVPVEGTPFGGTPTLPPFEALKIISLYRFMLPRKEIRVCGGRLQVLGEFNSFVFMAGADGLLTGDCLTTEGRSPEDDLLLAEHYGLKVEGQSK